MYYKNIFNKELMKQRKVEESEMRNWLKTLRNNKKFSQADVAKEVIDAYDEFRKGRK